MLVLSRKQGQSVVFAGGTVIRVLGVKGNQVRIGIDAPGKTACCERNSSAACRSPSPAGRGR
jgi:carbon storage regulator CsrA